MERMLNTRIAQRLQMLIDAFHEFKLSVLDALRMCVHSSTGRITEEVLHARDADALQCRDSQATDVVLLLAEDEERQHLGELMGARDGRWT